MSHFAGENTRFGYQWSNARLLAGRQNYAKRAIRLNRANHWGSEAFRSVSPGDRGNVIQVDFTGSGSEGANRLLRQTVHSTEGLPAALLWIGISAAAVLAFGFLGAGL
ncbi:MAG: hypothetical protein JO308_01085 [Verrucomicrobia bacterium]|nr:hypothetical protein [Verrucomicrobiota bacterium]